MRVYELECFSDFYVSLFMSFMIGVLFDLVRSFKIKNRKLSDFIFSTSAFILICYVWVFRLGGNVRWYVVLTIFLGIVLYFFCISKLVFITLTFFTKKIVQIYYFIFKILLTVLRFLGKIVLCIGRAFLKRKNKEDNHYDKSKI